MDCQFKKQIKEDTQLTSLLYPSGCGGGGGTDLMHADVRDLQPMWLAYVVGKKSPFYVRPQRVS